MLGFFSRRKKTLADPLLKKQRVLDSFMRPSRALVDSRDLTIPEKRLRYTLFTYGAIMGLMPDADGTEILALLLRHLQLLNMMPEQEISYLLNQCPQNNVLDNPFCNAGLKAFQEWQESPGTGVTHLARYLSDQAGT